MASIPSLFGGRFDLISHRLVRARVLSASAKRRLSQTYWVRPKGWQTHPQEESWTLADLEYPMPQNFLRYCFIYNIPNTSSHDKQHMVETLKTALELSLSQCRTLGGSFRKGSLGEIHIIKERESSVPFIVKNRSEAVGEDDRGASIQDLSRAGFPPSEICRQAKLDDLGKSQTNAISCGNPVSTFQLTWLPGGMALTVGFHHYCMDGGGFAEFLKQWAGNSLALERNTKLPSWDPVFLDRSRLNGRFVQPENRVDPPEPPGIGAPMSQTHELRSVVIEFTKTTAAQLKAAATPQDKPISTFDAISALLWRVHTRARLAMYELVDGELSVSATAVDLRPRLDPPLPPHLQANATLSLRTPRVPVLEVVSSDSLSYLASLIRKAHTSSVEAVATQTANAVAAFNNKAAVSWKLGSVPRFTVVMSDRRATGAYEADFGFGRPVAVRNVNAPVEPCMMRLLPARPNLDAKFDEDAGYEVQIPVESPCFEEFVKDPELLQYAKIVSF
ncbi:transferase family-domain-containing protein [Xylariales sp. AK1849]|nr:transferase family-domain-containing protein [Xylariales sp. AK1849]